MGKELLVCPFLLSLIVNLKAGMPVWDGCVRGLISFLNLIKGDLLPCAAIAALLKTNTLVFKLIDYNE